MLQNIRNHVQGWIAGLIIAALSITFALWGIQYYISTSSGNNKSVAKVGDHKITAKDLQQSYQRVVHASPQLALLQGKQRDMLKQEVLTQMINQQAYLNLLNKHRFNASTQQVRALIMSNPNFQEAGKFSKSRFNQILMQNNLTEQQLYQQMRQNIISAQLENGLLSSSLVLPSEVSHAYRLMNQTRDFGYLIVPSKLFAGSIKPTKAELEKAYKANQQQLTVPEQVSIQYILLSPKAIMKTVTVSAQEIQSYYDSNKSNYRTPMQWQVKANGKTFWISSAKANTATFNALSALGVGKTSKPVATQHGTMALTLLKVKQPTMQSLSQVKSLVTKALKTQKAENILSKQADQLSNLTYTNPSSLAPAAKALNLTVNTTPLFSKKGTSKGITSVPSVVNAAFSEDVLMQGNNSNPIDLKNGGMLVLRVNQHVAAHVPALKTVKAQLIKLVNKQDANQKAQALAQSIDNAIQKGTNPKTLATQYKLIWVAKNKVSHTDKSIPSVVLSDAFYTRLNKTGVTSNIVTLNDDDYAVVMLKAVHFPKKASIPSKDQSAITTSLDQYAGKMAYNLFRKSAVEQADVKMSHS